MEYVDCDLVYTNGKQFYIGFKRGGTFLTCRYKGQYTLSPIFHGSDSGYNYFVNSLHWHFSPTFEEIQKIRNICMQCGYAISMKSLLTLKEKYEKITINR